MKITMDDSRITSVSQLADLIKSAEGIAFSLESATVKERYAFIAKTIKKFSYKKLVRKDKRIIYTYLRKITGYKKAQLYRLIHRAEQGNLKVKPYKRLTPHKVYTTVDIKLLEKTDELHLRLSELATKEILRREYEVFGKDRYQTIGKISHSHITNLRHSDVYINSWINHTKARQISIGETKPPENFGRPGSIRIDSVSQKDVFHINAVDEISQWEILFCVAQLREACMIPALKTILSQFPFVIFNFHSDRGKETINYRVAELLQRLVIKQTKSRSYHSGDNALAETKNGSVVRKNMGWEHIDQSFCDEINQYYSNYFNPYLNYHRPCAYPTISIDEKGKKSKVYELYQVPYEFLKNLPKAEAYLKKGITFEQLDTIAYSHSDNEFATIMREEERKLFHKIRQKNQQNGNSFS
jgi:hypothetical protein